MADTRPDGCRVAARESARLPVIGPSLEIPSLTVNTPRCETALVAGDLVTAVNENLWRAFATVAAETPAGESRRFGPLTAASAGVPEPLFNRVFVFDVPPIDELSAAVAWMAERDVPFWVTVAEPVVEEAEPVVEDVATHLADLDLEKTVEQPGMAMASLDEIHPLTLSPRSQR